MKKLIFVLSALLSIFVFVSCGNKPSQDNKSSNDTTAKTQETASSNDSSTKFKGQTPSVMMITDTGGVNDGSFNEGSWRGLQKAEKELGVKVSYLESHQASDYTDNFEKAIDSSVDLVLAIGFLMADHTKEAALMNPDTKYAIIDYDYGAETPSNVLGITFKSQEGAFLTGVVAALMTKTKKIGFIGGIKGQIIDQFEYGFRAGIKYIDPTIQVDVQYADSFSDSSKGKSIANQLYTSGDDIVFHAAGGVGNGVIEAAKEQNKWVIGVDSDQSYLAPDNMLTSSLKRVDTASYEVSKLLKEGNFQSGSKTYGLAENGVGIVESKFIPEDVLAKIMSLKEKILSGDIFVPQNENEFTQLTY